MEEITIVKRRSRVWPVLAILLVIALLIAAALWFMGDAAGQVDEFGWNAIEKSLTAAEESLTATST